jgi:hypothetical protein
MLNLSPLLRCPCFRPIRTTRALPVGRENHGDAVSFSKPGRILNARPISRGFTVYPARAADRSHEGNVYLAAVTSETPQYTGLVRSFDEGVTWEQLRDLRQKQVW